VKEQQVVKNS